MFILLGSKFVSETLSGLSYRLFLEHELTRSPEGHSIIAIRRNLQHFSFVAKEYSDDMSPNRGIWKGWLNAWTYSKFSQLKAIKLILIVTNVIKRSTPMACVCFCVRQQFLLPILYKSNLWRLTQHSRNPEGCSSVDGTMMWDVYC